MTKINTALQKPNPKGAPPTPAATPDNLLRPGIGENVPFQVRIPPAAKREFKAYAAARDLHASYLFLKGIIYKTSETRHDHRERLDRGRSIQRVLIG